MWINLVALAVILGCGYFFWVRPILMARPELKSFYEDEARVVAVVRKKIAAAVIVVGGVYVELANYIMPAITGVGLHQESARLDRAADPDRGGVAAQLFPAHRRKA